MKKINQIYILYPSGNINAIVGDKIPRKIQTIISRKILKTYNRNKPLNKQIEQVCFEEKPKNIKAIARLQLTGGEFSGNSALCLAFLKLKSKGLNKGFIEISGAKKLLKASISVNGLVTSQMPSISPRLSSLSQENYQIIFLTGITHIIVADFYDKSEAFQRKKAMKIITNNNLKSELATGIMFIKKIDNKKIKMKPYVYFKKDVKYGLFKETACGSGTTAVAVNEYLLRKKVNDLEVIQPTRNSLFITIKKKKNLLIPYLKGKVKVIYQGSLNLA